MRMRSGITEGMIREFKLGDEGWNGETGVSEEQVLPVGLVLMAL